MGKERMGRRGDEGFGGRIIWAMKKSQSESEGESEKEPYFGNVK